MIQANPFFLILYVLWSSQIKTFHCLTFGCCLWGGGGLVSFSYWLCDFSSNLSLKLSFFIFEWLISCYIDDSWQHSLVRYKWVLEAFETAKVSQSQRRIPKTQVLFVSWAIRALNRKGKNLICSLPISIFLFLFLLHQNENQLFISS